MEPSSLAEKKQEKRGIYYNGLSGAGGLGGTTGLGYEGAGFNGLGAGGVGYSGYQGLGLGGGYSGYQGLGAGGGYSGYQGLAAGGGYNSLGYPGVGGYNTVGLVGLGGVGSSLGSTLGTSGYYNPYYSSRVAGLGGTYFLKKLSGINLLFYAFLFLNRILGLLRTRRI